MVKNGVIRVLIAEDDKILRELLCEAMKQEQDLECCGQAENGLEALEALRREEPDVLLLDIIMPIMDGLNVLSELREWPKRPRIIAMSAFNHERIINAALSNGADFLVLKPYQYTGMFDHIRALAKQEEPARNAAPNRTDSMISGAVMELGIPTNSFGYLYLVQALAILLSHRGICLLGKDVYTAIADSNNTTAQCVEKALRKAIHEAFTVDSDALHRILKLGGVENVKHLSNGRFLTLMAQSLRQEKP